MKNTFLGLIMKLVLTFLATWIAYGLIVRNTVMWVFIVALAVTLVNYLIGDVMILVRYGHMSATVSNAVMAVIVTWLIDMLTVDFYMTWVSSLVFIVLIFIFEYFLHRYLVNDVVERR
jgi:hypothetical protein